MFTIQDMISEVKETARTMQTVTAQQIEDSRANTQAKKRALRFDASAWDFSELEDSRNSDEESREDIASRENSIIDQQERRS
jgi:hypothetical protein